MNDFGVQILIPQNHCESLIDSNQTCYSRKNFAISVKQAYKTVLLFCIRPTGLVPLLYPLILSFIAGERDVVSITHDASEAGRVCPHMPLWPPAHVAAIRGCTTCLWDLCAWSTAARCPARGFLIHMHNK